MFTIILLTSLSGAAQYQIADSLLQAGTYQLAIKEYGKITDSEFKVARVYAQLGDVFAALSAYEEGFKKDSTSTIPKFEYARLALNINDLVKASKMFIKLIEEIPDNASYSYYLGKSLVDMSIYDSAIIAFKKAISLNKYYRAART